MFIDCTFLFKMFPFFCVVGKNKNFHRNRSNKEITKKNIYIYLMHMHDNADNSHSP